MNYPNYKPKLIEKAEFKNISQKSTITFLQTKGLSKIKITESYLQYYKQNNLYKITFNKRPLGFCVIKSKDGKNAIVSTIENDENINKGLQMSSYIYQISKKRVYNTNYKQILTEIAKQQTPFHIVFKQNINRETDLHMCNIHSHRPSLSLSMTSVSCMDYQWDCSPFLITNENNLCLSPSISPLIGSDVYMIPSDYDSENEIENAYRPFTFGNKYIQKELNKDKLIKNGTKEILLIGCENSGKQTIMKQLKRMFGNGYSQKEKIKFIPLIHSLIIKQMQILLTIKDRKHILSNKVLKAKKYLDTISDLQCLNIQICAVIKYIWSQTVIKQMYKEFKFTKKMDINVGFFWNEIDRICHCDYIPTEYDILRVPYKPKGITEEKYTLRNSSFNVINTGMQKSNWKKWIDCFSQVDIVIFVASLDCYDHELSNYSDAITNYYIGQNYFGDYICDDIQSLILKYCIELGVGTKNAMSEQLLFWEKIINHKSLKDTQIVLSLNKFDLFHTKIMQTPISECPALKYYWKGARDIDASVESIRDKFFDLDNSRQRYIDCWYLTAMDYKSMKRNFDERIHKLLRYI
eukprot:86233_1